MQMRLGAAATTEAAAAALAAAAGDRSQIQASDATPLPAYQWNADAKIEVVNGTSIVLSSANIGGFTEVDLNMDRGYIEYYVGTIHIHPH